MEWVTAILGTFLKQMFGGIVEAINAKRRDLALRQLGISETERSYAEAALKAERTARRIVDESRALSGDALVARLRAHARGAPAPAGGDG